MERRHLLPAPSTSLEKAISETIDRLPELGVGSDALHSFKFDPIAVVIPYLIVEYGLGEIEAYLTDPTRVLREGIAWQRIRGTPEALHMALDWIGYDGDLEENPPTRFKWWWFQVHLPFEVRSSAFAPSMTAVARASKPLRSEFARVTAGYDKRGFRLNAHRLNGGALLNSWSGVRRAPGEPVLSLRTHKNTVSDVSPTDISALNIMRLRQVYSVLAAAATATRSSMSAGGATVGVTWAGDVPFQNAPFTDGPFGEPSPRVQTGY